MIDHKVCPQCGQPAVLQMDRCRRCGYLYPPLSVEPTQGFTRPLSAASERELRRAHADGRGVSWGWVAALVGVCAVAAGLMPFMVGRRLGAPVPGAPLTARADRIQAPSAGRDPTAGLFVEKEGRTEMPILTVSNADSDGMHLLLKDPTGKVLHLSIDPMATRSMPVPAGRYDIAISSDNPTIRPNYGDAVFRRFKDYSTTFVQSPYRDPIHLGD